MRHRVTGKGLNKVISPPFLASVGCGLIVGLLFTVIGRAQVMKGTNPKQSPARQQVAPAVFPNPDLPPPKWPEVPADSGYKEGMSAKEYFDHLCKTEAGEFIYRTIKDVEGIYQMRPQEALTDAMLGDRYYLEDPYGAEYGHEFTMGPAALKGGIQDEYVNPRYMKAVKGGYVLYKPDQNYKFLEKPIPVHLLDPRDSAKYLHYTRPNTDKMTLENGQYLYPRSSQPKLIEERVKELKSRYGFTWRGIERPNDRELGIAGGELIVLDLQTNEILAVRRGFLLSGRARNQTEIWWLSAQSCPRYQYRAMATQAFLYKVLAPSTSVGGGAR